MPRGDPARVPPLRPVLPRWCALGWPHVAVCAVGAALLLYFNALGLWYTDLWSHAAYGRWIVDHRALPTFEPFLPLARHERVINYCWLSQVIFALVERQGGAAGLSNLFAVVMTARFALSALACYLQTRRVGLALAGMFATLLLSWVRNPILRPEVFAVFCAQALIALMVVLDPAARQPEADADADAPAPWPRWVWIATPALFTVWVNAHSSVYVGYALLGAAALGRAIEVGSHPGTLFYDSRLRRWMLLGLLAALGTLLNPRGAGVVWETARLAGNPNLRTVSEWLPMTTTSLAGRLFAASWAVLFVIARWSERRVRAVEVIALGGFSLGALQTGRMIAWYAPVYVYVIMPHVAEIVSRRWPASPPWVFDPADLDAPPPGRSFRHTLVCAATIWAGLALSHLTDNLLGAPPRAAASLYHPDTPRALGQYLRDHPPAGQVWNSQVLGDWLLWSSWNDGAPGLALFTDSHMHVIPRRVWLEYQAIGNVRPEWRALLKRYRVSTLAVSKIQHPLFVAELRRASDWTIVYEDRLGIVATR